MYRSEKPNWQILLIDEDEDDCLLTRDMLNESQGREINLDWAASFEAGVEAIDQNEYDAVLVDYDLKPRNGIELIKKFSDSGYAAPLILYSGQAVYEIELEALQAGATAYLSKREATPLLLERLIRYAIERKRAEEQLKESDRTQRALIEKLASDQRKLEAVLASLPVGVWIVDPNGAITGKNKEADRIWAGDAPLLESMDQYEEYTAWWPDRDERVRPEEYPIAQAAKTGQPIEPVEMRIRRFDGTEGAVLVSAAPIRDDEGTLVGVIGINLDITERVQAEEALHVAHARAEEGRRTLEALLEHVPEGIMITNGPPDFRIKYVSRWGVEVSGRNIEDLLNHPAGYHGEAWGLKLADGETAPQVEQSPLYRASHWGEETSNTEMVVEGQNGVQVPILIKAAPIRDQQGEIVGAINCWLDITERKQAEALAAQKVAEAVASAHEADLRRAEMDALFEQMTEAVVLYGLDEYPVRVNSRVIETFGFDPTGMRPEEIAQKITLTNEKGRAWKPNARLLEKVMQGRTIRSETVHITNQAGERFIVSASSHPFYNSEGQTVGVLITWHDITERDQAAEALRESEQRYSALFNAKTNSIAHCRVIANEQGQPIDYEIIRVNDAYELITGIKREDIEGRRAREVFPGIEHFSYDYIGNFGRVGLYGEELNIEVYFETLQQWLAIYAYSPKPGEFTAIFTDVSQRKNTEQALHASEERFRLARQAIEAVVYDWDPIHNTVHQIDGIHEILGLPADHALPMKPGWWQERIHPEDGAAARQKLTAALEGETDSIDDEYRLQHFDGHWIHIWDRAFVMRDLNGQAMRVVGIAVDISERKEAEARATFLQQLGRDLNAVQRPAEAGKMVVERLGPFLCVDRCFISAVDLLNGSHHIRFDYQQAGYQVEGPSELDFNANELVEIFGREEIVAVEDTKKDARTQDIHDRIFAPMNTRAFVVIPAAQQINVVPLFAVTCENPHRWKEQDVYFLQQVARLAWLAIERAEVAERLIQSEERIRIALDNAPITVFTQDRDLRYTWIYNPLMGYTDQEVVGKREDEILPYEENAELLALKYEIFESGEPRQREVRVQVRNEALDLVVNAKPVFNEEGEVSGIIGAIMDITEMRRLQAQQLEVQASNQVQRWLMEHREKERMQLARTLHDKPLQDLLAVHLYLNNIADGMDKSFSESMAPVRQMMEQAIEEIRSMALELRPPMLMHMGLEKAMRAYANTFRQRNPTLLVQLDLEKDRQALNEDIRLALYRIYQELLQNVSEHANAGEVSISLRFPPGEVVLVVSDDGNGFQTPEQWLDLARTGHFGLVGIKERVYSIQGSIDIDTKPGKGTRVEVRAPID